MIIKDTMHYHFKIFGFISIRFSRDVHYFVPYAEYMKSRCEEIRGEAIVARQQSILSDKDDSKMDKAARKLETKQ